MSKILDGVLVAKKINERTSRKVQELKAKKINPHLAVILVGDDPASKLYVSIKERKCQKLKIDFSNYLLPENITEQELEYLIKSLNDDKNIHAIIIQLPLPRHLDTKKMIGMISSIKDADALTSHPIIDAPTASGIIEILKEYKIGLDNKKIVIVGYGKLVGKPLEKILKRDYNNLNINVCDSKTPSLKKITKKADIIITAVGKPYLITKEMIKIDTIIIDAGTAESKGEIIGDVDFEKIKNIVSYITPPKGGVGPVTVAKLLENTVILCEKQNKK